MIFRQADKNDISISVFILSFAASIALLSNQIRSEFELTNFEHFYAVNFLYLAFFLGQISFQIFSSDLLSFVENKIMPLIILGLWSLSGSGLESFGEWIFWVDDALLAIYLMALSVFLLMNIAKQAAVLFVIPIQFFFAFWMAHVFLVLFNRHMSVNIYGAEYLAVGFLQNDPLIFSALSTIAAKFNAPSLGIDSLSPFNYHFLALTLVGKISQLSKVPSIVGLFVTTQVLLFPLFLYSLVALTKRVSLRLFYDRSDLGNIGALPSLLYVAVCFFVLLIVHYMDPWKSYISSETAYVGAALALLSAGFIMNRLERAPNSTALLGFIFCSVFVVVITKPPLGVFLFLFVCYFNVRRSYASRDWLLSNFKVMSAGLLAIGLAYPLVSNPFQPLEVGLFKMFISPITYPAVEFALKMVTGVIFLFLTGFLVRKRLGQTFILFESALLLSLLSVTIPLVIDITGGSGYYIFQPVLLFSTLAMASALVFLLLEEVTESFSRAAASVFFFVVPIILLYASFWLFAYQVNFNYSLPRAMGHGLIAAIGNDRAEGYSGPDINIYVDSTGQARWIKKLKSFLAANDIKNTSTDTGIFIESDSDVLWQFSDQACRLSPLFLPSLVGLPIVAARYSPAHCKFLPTYHVQSIGGEEICSMVTEPITKLVIVSDSKFSIKECS